MMILPVFATEAVKAGEEMVAWVDSDTQLLSSKQEVISETECRLIPVPGPVDESTSYSTTGVSIGTL